MSYLEHWHPSPNFSSEPPNTREGLVVHHTCLSLEATVEKMLKPESQVSYHVIIARDGSRHRLVADQAVAWHAGRSHFHGRDLCNRFTLGLAFEGNTYREPLTDDQIASSIGWIEPRWRAYRWTIDWVIDHRQIAPGRKDDLNPVEWERFREALRERRFAT